MDNGIHIDSSDEDVIALGLGVADGRKEIRDINMEFCERKDFQR